MTFTCTLLNDRATHGLVPSMGMLPETSLPSYLPICQSQPGGVQVYTEAALEWRPQVEPNEPDDLAQKGWACGLDLISMAPILVLILT